MVARDVDAGEVELGLCERDFENSPKARAHADECSDTFSCMHELNCNQDTSLLVLGVRMCSSYDDDLIV